VRLSKAGGSVVKLWPLRAKAKDLPRVWM